MKQIQNETEFLFSRKNCLWLQENAEQDGLQLVELPHHTKLSQVAPPQTPYFYVELPSGDKLYHRVTNNFPLQFGRYLWVTMLSLNMFWIQVTAAHTNFCLTNIHYRVLSTMHMVQRLFRIKWNGMMNSKLSGRKQVWCISKYYPNTCLKGLRMTYQDILCSDQYSKYVWHWTNIFSQQSLSTACMALFQRSVGKRGASGHGRQSRLAWLQGYKGRGNRAR